ncbi:hypothetical protein N7527_005738 [Penicillium freii]|nr:hypothetical protein N7527_005738 [Penicillium freii]
MFEEGQFKRPTIAISSLDIGDVQVLLKLTHSLDNLEFWNRTPVELSPVCAKWIDITRDAFSKSGPNKALTRITLNNLLIFAHHFVTL